MKLDAVRLGVVGLGRGASVAEEAIGLDKYEICAICDNDPEKVEKTKKLYESKGCKNFKCFENYDEMLKSDINTVFIATYAIDHVNFAIKAMEAGKNVISEIPAVNSIEEAKTLRKAVKAHPEVKYICAENCFYWAFIQAYKGMYDAGKFGDIVYAESEYIHTYDFRTAKQEDFPKEHWRSYNPAIKYITHNLGPLLHIMNDRVVSVSCMHPEPAYTPYRPPKNDVAIFKTAKGAVIKILICFDAFIGSTHNFELIGTKGSIMTDKSKPTEDAHSFGFFSDIPGRPHYATELPLKTFFPGESYGNHGGADAKMMKDFIRCLLEDTEPPIDVDMAIRITIPGIIASESAKKGGEVMSIPDVTEL